VVLGFNAERNGNLVVLTEPFYLVGELSGASHGTPYSYDTHVPLLLLGPGIKSGWYTQPSSPADIAPTLATILKLNPPSNRSGRVLGEALIAR
jgi:arylsulfatase A-like enzyme